MVCEVAVCSVVKKKSNVPSCSILSVLGCGLVTGCADQDFQDRFLRLLEFNLLRSH